MQRFNRIIHTKVRWKFNLIIRLNTIEEALSKNENFYIFNDSKYSIKKFDIFFCKHNLIFYLYFIGLIRRFANGVFSAYSGFKAFCLELTLTLGIYVYLTIIFGILYGLYCEKFTKIGSDCLQK